MKRRRKTKARIPNYSNDEKAGLWAEKKRLSGLMTWVRAWIEEVPEEARLDLREYLIELNLQWIAVVDTLIRTRT